MKQNLTLRLMQLNERNRDTTAADATNLATDTNLGTDTDAMEIMYTTAADATKSDLSNIADALRNH